MSKQVNLLQGTLNVLILKAVSLGRLHGYGMLLRIQQISGQQLLLQRGSFYSPTRPGRRQLEDNTERSSRAAGAVSQILRMAQVLEVKA